MNKRQVMELVKVLKGASKVTVKSFSQVEKFGTHKYVQVFVNGKLFTEMLTSKFAFVERAMNVKF